MLSICPHTIELNKYAILIRRYRYGILKGNIRGAIRQTTMRGKKSKKTKSKKKKSNKKKSNKKKNVI